MAHVSRNQSQNIGRNGKNLGEEEIINIFLLNDKQELALKVRLLLVCNELGYITRLEN
jgi:hypothetical protein